MPEGVLSPGLYNGSPEPLRYDLTCRLAEMGPVFSLSATMNSVRGIAFPDQYLEDLERRFGAVGSFANDEDGIGFGRVFLPAEQFIPSAEYSTWEAALPMGTKRSEDDLLARMRLLVSISWILDRLRFVEMELRPRGLAQLGMFETCYGPRADGYAMRCTLAPQAHEWYNAHQVQASGVAMRAMMDAYSTMLPKMFPRGTDFRSSGFRVSDIRNWGDGLSLSVPEEGCHLGVEGDGLGKGPGWHLRSHNVRNAIQQLALLTAVASILRLIREEQIVAL